MTPATLRQEVLSLCEAYACAAQTGNRIVIQATAGAVQTMVTELLPDLPEPEPAARPAPKPRQKK